MLKLRNTLFITRQGAYLHKERETLIVEHEQAKLLQVPIHSIAHIFCFGDVRVSPFFIGFCGENNVNLAYYTEFGKYLGRFLGRQTGNVLLRRTQYRRSDEAPASIARNIIAAKIQASRRVLQRRLRNHGAQEDVERAVGDLNRALQHLQHEENLDVIRGIEGDAAACYFSVFQHLLTAEAQRDFTFDGRNRRPPRDPINAMLSLLYSVLGKEISGALQGVGLDPQVGFLHADRSGRDSLSQDILEEFRAWWIDRLVLSLVNRAQLHRGDFEYDADGAVRIRDETRKLLFTAFQQRKQERIEHPFLQEDVPIGILPHVQALLLSRHLRGDMEQYPPFLMR
jgi:CRISPR-associated protein Cas1